MKCASVTETERCKRERKPATKVRNNISSAIWEGTVDGFLSSSKSVQQFCKDLMQKGFIIFNQAVKKSERSKWGRSKKEIQLGSLKTIFSTRRGLFEICRNYGKEGM